MGSLIAVFLVLPVVEVCTTNALELVCEELDEVSMARDEEHDVAAGPAGRWLLDRFSAPQCQHCGSHFHEGRCELVERSMALPEHLAAAITGRDSAGWPLRDGPDPDIDTFIEALNKVPNPCCGKCGPNAMDAPDGPTCHCGKPSEHQAGACDACFLEVRRLAAAGLLP